MLPNGATYMGALQSAFSQQCSTYFFDNTITKSNQFRLE
jgi:hypothetical protein